MPILRDAKTGKLNAVGFTLFTAMVSFIIIGIGVVVMQHMLNSEQNYTQIMSSLLNQQEIDSTKDIIRLDALQVFNLIYRAKFFEYFDSNFSGGSLGSYDYKDVGSTLGLDNTKWSGFQEDFTCDVFFGNVGGPCQGSVFSVYVANKIIGLLYDYSGNFKGDTYWFRIYDYSMQKQTESQIDLTKSDKPVNLSATETQSTLKEGFLAAKKDNKFINLIGCSPTDQTKCENGSFYTNLDLLKIPAKNYLHLPRVFIQRGYDLSTIDDAILPRNIISLYVPMRLYGALATVRETLNNLDVGAVKNLSYGAQLDNIECKNFNGAEFVGQKITLNNKEIVAVKNKSDLLTEITTSLPGIKPKNDFDLNIAFVEIPGDGEYDSKVITVNINFGDATVSVPTFTQIKISKIQINLNVTDSNPFYSFGHQSTVYHLSGVKDVQSPTSSTIVCNCGFDSTMNVTDNCQYSG